MDWVIFWAIILQTHVVNLSACSNLQGQLENRKYKYHIVSRRKVNLFIATFYHKLFSIKLGTINRLVPLHTSNRELWQCT
jgi:hypothetical protein